MLLDSGKTTLHRPQIMDTVSGKFSESRKKRTKGKSSFLFPRSAGKENLIIDDILDSKGLNAFVFECSHKC